MADCVAAILASPQTRPDGSDSSATATDVVEEYVWFTMSETADILYNLADQRDVYIEDDIAHPIKHLIEDRRASFRPRGEDTLRVLPERRHHQDEANRAVRPT